MGQRLHMPGRRDMCQPVAGHTVHRLPGQLAVPGRSLQYHGVRGGAMLGQRKAGNVLVERGVSGVGTW
jgi:hypothetical protein